MSLVRSIDYYIQHTDHAPATLNVLQYNEVHVLEYKSEAFEKRHVRVFS